MPVEAYRHKLDVLAQHCAAVGRDPRDIRKSLAFGAVIAETEGAARERVEQIARAMNLPPETVRDRVLVGTPEQAAERLLRYVELGVGDFLVTTRAPFDYETLRLFIERVAPPVRQEGARLARS
jgi:alkanesulfonate monooxygenase SsuD/methylene tetrahydromethanopterin reductase-like flavin-dependent oxidoreductase (luciferase family)